MKTRGKYSQNPDDWVNKHRRDQGQVSYKANVCHVFLLFFHFFKPNLLIAKSSRIQNGKMRIGDQNIKKCNLQ